jgi:HAD superfamily hydrolase (TIGR01509 family)
MRRITVKGIFFDLYGTLLTFTDMSAAWEQWRKAFYDSVRKFAPDAPEQTFSELYAAIFDRPDPPKGKGLSLFERHIKAHCMNQKIQLSDANIHEIAETCLRAWHEQVKLDPETLPVLNQLKHRATLVLVSNFDHPPHVHALLSELLLAKLFHSVIISGEVNLNKPDPAIFRLGLQNTGLLAEEVAHVGDSDDDIEGALAAGCFAIRLDRTGAALDTPPSSDRTIVITKLSDLLEVIAT